MSAMNETYVAEVVFAGTADNPALDDTQAYLRAEAEVWSQNLDAMRVDPLSLYSFMELLSTCDTEYIETVEEHASAVAPSVYAEEEREPTALVDWGTVDAALGESQKILQGVQQLLTETLADMGIEKYEEIRVFSDAKGKMRLVSDHDRREEIEAALNSEANRPIRELYDAAMSGMNVAGGLVGSLSIPEDVLNRLKEKILSFASAS
ncbi:MAG: hypothetical protein LUE17_14690 [Planctomycetaceae bacterium]|nr:hypothetical protein [Planctomycetaceae bacterium]